MCLKILANRTNKHNLIKTLNSIGLENSCRKAQLKALLLCKILYPIELGGWGGGGTYGGLNPDSFGAETCKFKVIRGGREERVASGL